MFLVLFALSAGMLARLVLILTGQLKGPVLRQYERYGDVEAHYFPLPWLLGWSGLALVFGSDVMNNTITLGVDVSALSYVGVFLIVLAIISYYTEERIRDNAKLMPVLPRWANTLAHNTTRHERRRLAYMWLRLPLRTRLLYNTSDHAFLKWAELVILATL